MGTVIFNNVSSDSIGIVVQHYPGYNVPSRDYTVIHVPGRNGDVVLDQGSFQNGVRDYDIAIAVGTESFTKVANKVSEWLLAPSTYARLEDSYEPDYYRLAMYKDNVDITNILNQAGTATISFNCKPQRYLKSGETAVSLSEAGTLTNPTKFAALPIIKVKGTGSGSLIVGDYEVTISDINTETTLNSEIQDAYSSTENRNNYIICDVFPKLVPGSNAISFSGGITSIDVVPNWWTI